MKRKSKINKDVSNELKKVKKMYPSNPSYSHYKEKCICCELSGKKMNKEHLFPQWLLKRTNTMGNLLKTLHGEIPGKSFVIPLCEDCNTLLSKQLECPVALIFDNIEGGKGFNDYDAEKLIKWMWKIDGMSYWSICNETWRYSSDTLLKRVTGDIDKPRSRLSIAIGLIDDEREGFNYAPVGLDSGCLFSNVYVAGVFSKISIIVFYTRFRDLIDESYWTVYTLSDYPLLMNSDKKIFPKITFENGGKSIGITTILAGRKSKLEEAHEKLAMELIAMVKVSNAYAKALMKGPAKNKISEDI